MNREELIERVVGAWRDRDPHGAVRAAAEWHDLDAPARLRAFEETLIQRRIEAAADPAGLTGTARAVLARIRR